MKLKLEIEVSEKVLEELGKRFITSREKPSEQFMQGFCLSLLLRALDTEAGLL